MQRTIEQPKFRLLTKKFYCVLNIFPVSLSQNCETQILVVEIASNFGWDVSDYGWSGSKNSFIFRIQWENWKNFFGCYSIERIKKFFVSDHLNFSNRIVLEYFERLPTSKIKFYFINRSEREISGLYINFFNIPHFAPPIVFIIIDSTMIIYLPLMSQIKECK